jgi:hypothetical protein
MWGYEFTGEIKWRNIAVALIVLTAVYILLKGGI